MVPWTDRHTVDDAESAFEALRLRGVVLKKRGGLLQLTAISSKRYSLEQCSNAAKCTVARLVLTNFEVILPCVYMLFANTFHTEVHLFFDFIMA